MYGTLQNQNILSVPYSGAQIQATALFLRSFLRRYVKCQTLNIITSLSPSPTLQASGTSSVEKQRKRLSSGAKIFGASWPPVRLCAAPLCLSAPGPIWHWTLTSQMYRPGIWSRFETDSRSTSSLSLARCLSGGSLRLNASRS